jgi:hypothetical protein
VTSPDDLARRIKAARALGGFGSVAALVEAIGEPGLGVRTLGKIEAGEREPRPWQLALIARECGVSEAFFSADLATLAETPAPLDERLASIEEKVDRLLGERSD